ncbi:MAG TPA: flagellar hook-associated protein FlgK [Acidimicrobiia bacterium]|nr:flagellar hook-associated protein FlgK [Acidimicrobiia bacterium]
MSDFAGLRLALSALQAQRRGVETAAQNAANSNTVGYSRQRVDLESVGAPAVPALFSRYEGSGGGVRVAAITRYRDEFLELRAALEHATASSLSQQATSMKRVEQLFNEPSDDGIAKQLSEFWAAWDDIANHPEEPAPRTQLLERAQTVLRSLNATSANLSQLRQDTIAELNATVADINGMATSIAELNKAIKANTVAGLSANELMDKRDLLANKLAAASGVSGNPSAVAAGRAGFGPLDGGRALDLAELAGDLNGADASYRQVVVQLGVEVQTTSNRNDIQTKAVAALDGARAQVSGVNLDEEMTALVQFQHAYEAAARFLSAVDEMLDTLINRTAV